MLLAEIFPSVGSKDQEMTGLFAKTAGACASKTQAEQRIWLQGRVQVRRVQAYRETQQSSNYRATRLWIPRVLRHDGPGAIVHSARKLTRVEVMESKVKRTSMFTPKVKRLHEGNDALRISQARIWAPTLSNRLGGGDRLDA